MQYGRLSWCEVIGQLQSALYITLWQSAIIAWRRLGATMFGNYLGLLAKIEIKTKMCNPANYCETTFIYYLHLYYFSNVVSEVCFVH